LHVQIQKVQRQVFEFVPLLDERKSFSLFLKRGQSKWN
jgi:hypothetical protein